MTEITWMKMQQSLANVHTFVDEKFTDEALKKRLLPRLEEAYSAFKSAMRTSRTKEKLKRIDRALALLKSASTAEKRWINAHNRKAWGDLYHGASKTPYSDLIKAQKAFPDRPYIWAFRKMLAEYREQLEKEGGG